MFTEWTQEIYEENLKEMATYKPDALAGMYRGHTKELHTDQTDMQLISRMLKENKNMASAFTEINGYSVLERIGDALYYKSAEITDWIYKERFEFPNVKAYSELVLNLELCPEPIGHGFRPNLEEYETNQIVIVLRRDFDKENQFGFYMITAYPDIEKGKPTGKKYNEIDLLNGENNSSVLEKIKAGLTNIPVNAIIDFDFHTERQELSVYCNVSNFEKYAFYMDEKRFRMKKWKEKMQR